MVLDLLPLIEISCSPFSHLLYIECSKLALHITGNIRNQQTMLTKTHIFVAYLDKCHPYRLTCISVSYIFVLFINPLSLTSLTAYFLHLFFKFQLVNYAPHPTGKTYKFRTGHLSVCLSVFSSYECLKFGRM